jgi:hypothetical protein
MVYYTTIKYGTMKKSSSFIRLLLVSMIVIFYASSCRTSSTTITGTWEKENIIKEYNHILVAALTSNVNVKSTVEQHLEESLREHGLEASQSIELLPPRFIDDDNQKQKILNAIKEDGADAILTVSLIDRDTETRYVPGSASYAPYPAFRFYGNFWGYYNHWSPQFYSPGYYSEDKIYYIETNLYDAETEELIWSAQSQTYNPENLSRFSRDFGKEIVQRLLEDNIL